MPPAPRPRPPLSFPLRAPAGICAIFGPATTRVDASPTPFATPAAAQGSILAADLGAAPPESGARGSRGAEADTLDLAAYHGKVVYLDFWASWCKPCRASFPWMADIQKRLGDQGLAVVTVNLDKKREAAAKFLQEFSPDIHVLYDPEGKLASLHGLKAMPTSCLYGRDGTLRATHTGFSKEQAAGIEKEILGLLGEEAPDATKP